MGLEAGTRLGSFDILSSLGEGGMGIVYRARDMRLNRDVALKILPDAFASDPERLARFEREAQVLASLNHPYIAAIHGIEESNGVRALVLEFVDGETLADRIARGPIPIDDALPIARQIAEALEAAHEQGIIHRDLKPANIKLRGDDTVKVLDFGLAKLAQPAGAAGSVTASLSPTITSPAVMTGVGMLLGTAAYMSPEQAKGREADKRSDIWAFGCVLFEMLAGRRPFAGEDVPDTLAAVLRGDADWSLLPSAAPANIRDLLARCLTKDRAARLRDMSVARFLLDSESPPLERARATRRAARFVAAGAVVAVVAAAIAAWVLWPRATPQRVGRFTAAFSAPLSVGGPFRDVAISPDGTWILYTSASGTNSLMLRRFDQLEAQPLGVPRSTQGPFFSADSKWIGFYSGGELWKVPITGGPAISICRVDGILRGGATWGSDDTIVFSSATAGTGLMRVSAAGGRPQTLTTPDVNAGEIRHILPAMLPGAGAVLFTALLTTASDNTSSASGIIAAVDMQTGTRTNLIRGGSQAEYVAPGYLVYNTAAGLMAVRFDATRLQVEGDPIRVTESVLTKPTLAAEFSVSRDGTLVYVPGGAIQAIGAAAVVQPARTLMWVDRRGKEEPLETPARPYVYARLSPDGRRIAVDVRDPQADIWIWDIARRTLSRLTDSPALETSPVWTPDGRRVIFGSQKEGAATLYWQPSDGAGGAERLTTGSNNQVPTGISADGRRLLFWEATPRTDRDVRVLHLDGDRASETLLGSAFAEGNAVFSPDAQWVAYESNESGSTQVYVRPFPDVGRQRVLISASGGRQPLWAHSGRELFYFNERNELMVTPVHTGAAFEAGVPVKLLNATYYSGGAGAGARTYDLATDDRRFLVIKGPPEDSVIDGPKQMVVVVNWVEELKARLGR